MASTNNSRSGSFSTRLLGSLAALVGIVVVMFLFLGRPDSTPSPDTTAKQDQATESGQRRSEDELLRILDGVKPGRLGISAERATLASELNSWRKTYVTREEAAKLTGDSELADRLLTGETLARVKSDRFLPEDVSYLRECFLAHSIVEQVSANAKTDLERIVGLFNYVMLTSAFLTEEQAVDMPLTPYESLLFGIGTGDDRAWTFATVLRQLNLDAVILIPGNEAKADRWLIGVIDSRNGVLLFDPRIGLPIPSAKADDKSPLPSVPATLAEVLESDASFRLLDIPSSPYALTSDDFKKNLKVQLIGSSSVWAPRMAELQYLLPSEVLLEVYAGLGKSQFRANGMYDRVVEAGKGGLWTAEQVSVWPHPESEIVQIEAARGAEGTKLAELFYVFAGPYNVVREDSTGKQVMGRPDYTLHAVRIDQLMGDHTIALRHYLNIRRAATPTSPQANHIAADYAALWTGVSQFDTHRYTAALATFRLYVERHPQLSPWGRTAFEWGARCLLANDQLQPAAQLLASAPPSTTPRRDIYLVRRWLKLAGVNVEALEKPAPAAEAAPASETPPATPAPMAPAPTETPMSETPKSPAPVANPPAEATPSTPEPARPEPPALPQAEPEAAPAPMGDEGKPE